MFLGTFDYAMDERGRVPLPPRYREAFRDGIVLSQGSPDPCLRVYTAAAFTAQASEFLEHSQMQRRGRDLRKVLFSRSHVAELDKQNRILIPAALRAYAGLSAKVLVIGAGECLEIWAPESYEAEMARIEREFAQTLESLEARGPR
ncbi:MAG TPA: division/cell wall cluster transcriptional repressor MraZ [Dehalococcoidia bacterium]|nr:division/cell wall cluster transcriptional repressor MraZ [Dehalococcoidia bacterium]